MKLSHVVASLAVLVTVADPQPAPALITACQDDVFAGVIVAPAGLVRDATGGVVVLSDHLRLGNGTRACPDFHVDAQNVVTQWPAAGAPVPGYVRWARPDGAGGVIAVWRDTTGPATRLLASRWDAGGNLASGWPMTVSVADTHATAPSLAVAPDGLGGAFVMWVESASQHLFAQHVFPNGTTASETGVVLCSAAGTRSIGALLADGAGGAFATWTDGRGGDNDVYAQRIDGALSPQWTVGGVAVASLAGSTQQAPAAAPDGAGGLFIAWEDDRAGNSDPYLQRMTGAGAPVAGWPTNGIPITTAAGNQRRVGALSDGAGGVFLTWEDPGSSSCITSVTRIDGTGLPASGWTTGGTPACTLPADGVTLSSLTFPALVSDDAGGVRVVWANLNGTTISIRAQSFTAKGTLATGWPADGVSVASTYFTTTMGIEGAADATDGTLFLMYSSSFGGVTTRHYSLGVEHLGNDGLVPVQASFVDADVRAESIRLRWFAEGIASPASLERAVEDGAWTSLGPLGVESGGYLVYEDRDVAPGRTYRYRLAWIDAGVAGHTAPESFTVPAAPQLALAGAAPNPSAGDPRVVFTLPAHAAATRIEIFDVAGRRAWSRGVGDLGEGRHEVHVPVALAPGVYRLRLTCGAEVREAAVTVVR